MARGKSTNSTTHMERELRKLGRNLDGLIVKTKKANAAARVKYASQLKTLEAKRAQALKLLAKLNRQTAAAGAPIKAGFRKAWNDLSAAAAEARKRFRDAA